MNIKKWLATVVAASSMFLAACGGGQQQASTEAAPAASTPAASVSSANSRPLRVAMNAEFPPFETQDANGNISGFDVDLLRALAKDGGFEVEFVHQPWESLFNSLKNGDVDILASSITITDERKQTMGFTEPYFQITQVVLLPQGKNVASVEELKGLNRIGVVTGHTGDLAAGKILGATNPKIARFETLPLLLKELDNGGVDAAISDSSVVMEFIKNNSDKGFTMIEVPDFEIENYGIAVHPSNTELLAKLNASLQNIRASGEYARIHEQYFGKLPANANASAPAASAVSAPQ